MRKILYIQHASAMGGSVISLQLLVRALDRSQFEPVVACVGSNPEIIDLYRKEGIEAFHWPGIDLFMHTTGGEYRLYNPIDILRLIRKIVFFNTSIRASEALIQHVQPDLVHLNSLVLPSSAIAVKRSGIKLVWHVRESVVQGTLGLRKQWLGHLVRTLSDKAIFISEDGQRLLVGANCGTVIPNYIDFERFDYRVDGTSLREELGLGVNSRVILFLGGRSVIKGIFPLLKAMSIVTQQMPGTHLLVANGAYHFSGRRVSAVARTVLPMIGYGTVAQRVDELVVQYQLHHCVHMLEWRSNVPPLFAISDLVVFPSVVPHFARPVIEASAMRKPVVASRIGGVEELVEDGKTGVLVPPHDVGALANAIIDLLKDTAKAQSFGHAGYELAKQRFSAAVNVRAIVQIYEDLLSGAK